MGNFKVGDKVRAIDNAYCFSSLENEWQGVVTEVFSDGKFNSFTTESVNVADVKEKQTYSGLLAKHFELVKPSDEQRIETLEKEVSELKLIVHELRERKPSVFATLEGQDLEAEYAEQVKEEPSADISVEDKQSDVIEFEGQQYRKVEREAVEGDVVVFRENDTDPDFSTINTPYLVVEDNKGKDPRFDSGCHGVYFSVYADDHKRTPETVDVYEPIIQPVQRQTVPCSAQTDKTANELRADVIEKAKAFFETNNGNEFVFSVDEDKRTAFCWKLVSNGCGYNTIHGLSTCHPNDVFNEHIGKAIALGRALGLDVSEFEQAVQPSEYVVGQIVDVTFIGGGKSYLVGEVTKVANQSNLYFEKNAYDDYCGEGTFYPKQQTHVPQGSKIINDTNAIYGGVE